MAFSWSNSITTGTLMKNTIFTEITDKSNTILNTHCASNYTSYYSTHNGGNHASNDYSVTSCSTHSGYNTGFQSSQHWPN